MYENIDIRMSNFINILFNPELKRKMPQQAILAMQEAISIYSSTTAIEYVNKYKKQQELNKLSNEREDKNYSKLEPSVPVFRR